MISSLRTYVATQVRNRRTRMLVIQPVERGLHGHEGGKCLHDFAQQRPFLGHELRHARTAASLLRLLLGYSGLPPDRTSLRLSSDEYGRGVAQPLEVASALVRSIEATTKSSGKSACHTSGKVTGLT